MMPGQSVFYHPDRRSASTHSLRFDRILMSTCAWLRTAVWRIESGPLLISQFSYRHFRRQHQPLRGRFLIKRKKKVPNPEQENIQAEQFHTPYKNQPVSIFCSRKSGGAKLTCTRSEASGEGPCSVRCQQKRPRIIRGGISHCMFASAMAVSVLQIWQG